MKTSIRQEQQSHIERSNSSMATVNHGEETKPVEALSYFEEQQESLQAIGPAIDDELTAHHMAHLVQGNDVAIAIRDGGNRKVTQVFLSGDAATPNSDPETFEAIFATAGPAIDDVDTAHYASNCFG